MHEMVTSWLDSIVKQTNNLYCLKVIACNIYLTKASERKAVNRGPLNTIKNKLRNSSRSQVNRPPCSKNMTQPDVRHYNQHLQSKIVITQVQYWPENLP